MTQYWAFIGAAGIVVATYIFASHWRILLDDRKPRPQWIILYACSLQLIWGFQLFAFGRQQIAAWSGFMFVPDRLLGVMFILAAVSAYTAIVKDKSILWMLPQQGMMMIAAIGSLTSIILGHYADGTPYPRLFIFADQLPSLLTALWHTAAITNRERGRIRAGIRYDLQCNLTW